MRPLSARRPRLLAAAALGIASVGSLAAITGAAATPTAVPTAPTAKVLQDVLPGLGALTDLGELPATRKLTVGVLLPGNTSGLEAFDAAISDKNSPLFGQTLTPEQVDARFGVSRAASSQAQTALEADGLKATYVARDAGYVMLSGTVAQVEKTFRTSLHSYSALGRTWFANTAGATVPQAVGAVTGLTDMSNVHTDAGSQDTCDVAGAPTGLCMGTTIFPSFWGAYDMPNNGLTGNLGQGQKIAVFGEGNVNTPVSDLRKFEAATTVEGVSKPVLPQVPVREVLVSDPQVATTDAAGTDEWDLDSQSSTGVSPDLSELDFYFGPDLSDQTIGAIYSSWVNDDAGPMIGNSSFGGCEAQERLSGGEQTTDVILAEAVAEGRTMFTSTGDNGAGGCIAVANAGQPGAPGIQDPGASPYVTAVGGTVLYTASDGSGGQKTPITRALEYGWNDSTGGYSDFEPEPAVQANLNSTLPNRLPCAGSPTTTCRTVPDVASMAGDQTTNAYAIVANGADSAVVGTSLSSPTMAGMWARVRAGHNPIANGCTTTGVKDAAKADLGFAQTDLYDVAESSEANDAAAFFDVGNVTNGSIPTTNAPYPTLPRSAVDPTGYDLVTGLGVPDVAKLTALLDCGTAPATTALPAPGTLTVVDANSFANGNGARCPANGTATDPTGDELTGADPGVDLTAAKVTYDSSAVTFTVDVAGAPVAPMEPDTYVVIFDYQGTIYGVDADTDGTTGYGEVGAVPSPGSVAYRLFKIQLDQVQNAPVLGTLDAFEEPYYLGDVTGTSDTTKGTYSITLPYATFNTDAGKGLATSATPQTLPTSPLGLGSTISGLEVLSGIEPAIGNAGQQIVSDTLEYDCPVLLSPASVGYVAAPVVKKTTTRKTTRKAVKKVSVTTKAGAPSGTLAYTGIPPYVPALGLLALAGSLVALRRRATR